MRPWNFTYCLQNLILIFTYFFLTTDFITSVRENLLYRDKDIWENHVNQIVHYIKQPDEAEEDPTIEVEVLQDYDESECLSTLYKWTIGYPVIKDTIIPPTMTDVTESAAIYRIKRSYERGRQKDKVKPMDKNNLYAKSE